MQNRFLADNIGVSLKSHVLGTKIYCILYEFVSMFSEILKSLLRNTCVFPQTASTFRMNIFDMGNALKEFKQHRIRKSHKC